MSNKILKLKKTFSENHKGTREEGSFSYIHTFLPFRIVCRFPVDVSREETLSEMDSCVAVEKEIDRVINRFTAINEHSSQVIGDVVNQILELKNHLEEGESRYCLPDQFPICCFVFAFSRSL